MSKLVRMMVLVAAIVIPAATATTLAPRPAAAQTLAAPGDERSGSHLLILAKDGAFSGNLWALAGRKLALDRADPRVRRIMTGLTDAHGWQPRDRAQWLDMDLSRAASLVQAGEIAAVAVIADPSDPAVDAALRGGQFRVIDLGDNVSRAHAGAAGLQSGWFDQGRLAAVSLGGTTLVVDAAVQVADRPD